MAPALFTATLGLSALSTAVAFAPSFPYTAEKVRGVNLGGWLVLEPWITPSLFDATGNEAIIDEWTFGQYQDVEIATTALKQHWDTWITEDDFAQIAAAGLNHVRLPIGYWAFEVGPGEPYIQGQLPYFQKAVEWAEKYGLYVVADLHGVPDSQNGYDNSGQHMPYPRFWGNDTSYERALAVVQTMMDLWGNKSDVVSIVEPMNEPAGWYSSLALKEATQYWLDTYPIVRHPNGDGSESNTIHLAHDAFQNVSYWHDFESPEDGYVGVGMDTHFYHVFSEDEINLTMDGHLELACAQKAVLENFTMMIITDCTLYLNGRNATIGQRYDGTYAGSTYHGSCTLSGYTGDASLYTDEYKAFLRKFWEAQVQTWEAGGDGWFQWAWKIENGTMHGEEWSYQRGLQFGWIPANVTDFKYPNICDSYSSF
ncbi:exo-beta-1,3-glucanase [Fistulina hepatica ATCC 64428]|uniref:Exo-beta-1,3-glucanase n=1 Tax=Fistulina hepatica ATCC 64428 TaxID=1128425 RepID=A0A0D7AL32_9AGAR|nr:exo-beta-1,3-glucanase [Fistulina hepatica ATCC 64428]